MANTDLDVTNTENTAAPANVSPRKQKIRIATAAVVVGVMVILLGVAAWVFLFPHRDVPARADSGLPPLSEADKALIQAVRDNDAGEAVRLLRAGANIGAVDNSGSTAMKAAIALNRLDIVRQFLDMHGDAPLIQENNSFLVYAIVQNRLEIVQEFLKRGTAAIDRVDKNGCTPLMYAVDRSLTAAARDLLKAGADVNRLDRYGRTPLIQAVTVGKPDMISLLLEAGADTRIVSVSGDTAMSIAQRKNRKVVIALLANAGVPLFY
ncbi:MAG: ankyrin repeat domain-containing protein [Synergistaceae bacterium]|jgi:ankyrin repeat protein|nr:ankyrin repeat domain-containing protein [Synergistaceae bacterium]